MSDQDQETMITSSKEVDISTNAMEEQVKFF